MRIEQCKRGVVLITAASLWAPQLVARGVPTECAEICEYVSQMIPEYGIQLVPDPGPFAPLVSQHRELGDQWVLIERWRTDHPEPPPPVVPMGLAGLVWAADNPPEFWRMFLPIPPEQAPELMLTAHPRAQKVRSILASTPEY